METMHVTVEQVTEEAQLTMTCACGSCHPTATFYRDDPGYEHHEAALAEGPCCCGRFFAIGATPEAALTLARSLAQRHGEGERPRVYEFSTQRLVLPWGAEVAAVSADMREAE